MAQSDFKEAVSSPSPVFSGLTQDNREIQFAHPIAVGKARGTLMERFFGVAAVLSRDPELDGRYIDAPNLKDKGFEQLISQLLKYGVLLCSGLVLLGGMLYLFQHGAEVADYRFFHGEPQVYCSPLGMMAAIAAGQRRGIIQVGLLGLIVTPVLRVILSLLIFVWRRDYPFVLVTGMVLSGLLYGLISPYL